MTADVTLDSDPLPQPPARWLGWSLVAGFLLLALVMAPSVEIPLAPRPEGRDLWLIADVSRSMLATDAKPDRLAVLKRTLRDIVDTDSDHAIGLIAFAGAARLWSPPTRDRKFLHRAIDELSIDSAPAGGSDAAEALRLLAQFRENSGETRAILVSDGGESKADPLIDAARQANARLWTIGVGDATKESPVLGAIRGAPIVATGKVIMSRLNESSLKDAAVATGAAYFHAPVDTPSLLQAIASKPDVADAGQTGAATRGIIAIALAGGLILTSWRGTGGFA